MRIFWNITVCIIRYQKQGCHAYVPDFRTNPAVFLGGGSLLLKQQIERSSDFKYIEFIDDVRANAIGYEKLTTARLRRG